MLSKKTGTITLQVVSPAVLLATHWLPATAERKAGSRICTGPETCPGCGLYQRKAYAYFAAWVPLLKDWDLCEIPMQMAAAIHTRLPNHPEDEVLQVGIAITLWRDKKNQPWEIVEAMVKKPRLEVQTKAVLNLVARLYRLPEPHTDAVTNWEESVRPAILAQYG